MSLSANQSDPSQFLSECNRRRTFMCRPVIKELIKKIIEVYFKSSVTTSERRFCFHVINFLKVIGETCEKCQ